MTPIDLLVERLAENGILHSSDIAEANELFKQQIIDACKKGYGSTAIFRDKLAEQYYQETFKSE